MRTCSPTILTNVTILGNVTITKHVDNGYGGFAVNSEATVVCNPGAKLVTGADETRTCQVDGTWSGSQAHCEGEQHLSSGHKI